MSTATASAASAAPAATAATAAQTVQTFQFVKDELIEAPIEIVFQAVLDEAGPEGQMPDGTSLAMKLEPWPGGRWLRDLGNNTGHLWGHVQVIKPPTLLELSGPMFMSYPAVNHVLYRLAAEGSGTRLTFTHRSFGLITEQHKQGMQMGWNYKLTRVRELAARKADTKGSKR